MNLLILMAGQEKIQSEDRYPLCLAEIEGKPLIETLLDRCRALPYTKVIVAMRAYDIKRFRLDKVVRLLDDRTEIIAIDQPTQGAACTALLAAAFIDNAEPLLILNADELLDIDYAETVIEFQHQKLDAATVVFNSVHPRYSFVRLNTEGWIIEAAEKNPISRHATAGFYYFAHGADFIAAAKSMIRKDAQTQGAFYICPCFNEMILKEARIGVKEIDAKQFHPIKSEAQLQRYERISEELGR